MNKFLLSGHVLAAIIFGGPVTVAASMFPPLARRALTSDDLLTVHWPAVSSALGPTHGTAYLVTNVTAFSAAGPNARAKWLSFVPGIGGYLALRSLR